MIEDLEIFATVVELSSLNKASRVLNLSQPALSRKIRLLEENLGINLFTRRGKRLELTESGRIAYDFALEFRMLQKRFAQELLRHNGLDKESLTLGASLTTLQSTLPDVISLMRQYDATTDIKTVTGKTHEIVTLVKEKKVDVGLVASAISDRSLNCIPLFDDHLTLVVPQRHPLAAVGEAKIRDLNRMPMIVFSKGTWYRILMDDLFHRYSVMPEIKMEIDSFEAILRLIATCHLAALLPESYLRQNMLDDNGLAQVLIAELRQTVRTTSLIYNDPDTLNDAAIRFIQLVQRQYAK
ncbi:MAG TPA: LysR family transcriptional regulator [Bacilli bacterium]